MSMSAMSPIAPRASPPAALISSTTASTRVGVHAHAALDVGAGVGDDDLRALLRRTSLLIPTAHAAGATGDDGDFAFEMLSHRLSCSCV